MSSKPLTHLQPPLDPGTSSKRRSRSFCSLCLIWSSLIFGAFIVFGVIVPLLDKVISQLRDPHFKLLVNVSTSDGRVIRPLVDQDQTFDIAVTVWLRAQEEEEKAWKESLMLDISNSDSDASVTERQRRLEEEILEVPLYSDIAFRGLRLSDRHVTADVKFRLPTKKFLDQNLTVTDLRGSFVLIPSSPSPLDYLVNFSTSYPKSIAQPPVRSWPFPLNSNTGLARALADEAIDSFGCSTSLLEFHEIYPRCAMPGSSALLEAKVEEYEDADDDEKEPGRLLKTHNDDKLLTNPARKIKLSDRDPDSPLYAYTVPHPHIATRSQLRIVEETRHFDLTAYNKAHKELIASYCRGAGSSSPSRELCMRLYKFNGHLDTRMKLEKPRDDDDESAKRPRIEWVYSPFMSARRGSAGPLDLIPVPISRENCTFEGNDTTQAVVLPKQYEEYMDITWRISFSGRSPGKLMFGDVLGGLAVKPGFNQTEYEKQKGQTLSEFINGIAGHRFYADAHPRRRALIEYIPLALPYFVHMLDVHYWYTRTSTRFISIIGTMHTSVGNLAPVLMILSNTTFKSVQEWTWIRWVSMIPFFLLLSVMISPYINMMKVVLRVKWQWKRSNWRTQAPVRRVPATHQERASERLDRRTDHIMMTGLLLALLAYLWFYPDGQVIIPPNTPNSPGDTSLSQWRKTSEALWKAITSVGTIYQILLNHRGHTFAGRSATIISFVGEIIHLLIFVPWVVGRYDLRPGLSTKNISSVALSFTLAWQAIWMRGVPHQGGEMDDDED